MTYTHPIINDFPQTQTMPHQLIRISTRPKLIMPCFSQIITLCVRGFVRSAGFRSQKFFPILGRTFRLDRSDAESDACSDAWLLTPAYEIR